MRAQVLVVVVALFGAAVPIARAQLQGTPPPPPAGTTTATSPYATTTPPPTYYAPAPYAPYGAQPPGVPTAPKQLDYEEGDPIPPGYHLKQKVRLGPVIGGACSFGVLWLMSVFASSIGSSLGDKNVQELWLPVVGPFITLGKVSSDSGSKPLLIVDGVGQGVGVGLFLWGVTSPRTVLVRNDIAEVHVVPMIGSKSAGFGLGGLF